jgi:ABC-type dipeptide/oligopeptide/nickel transport system permease subunit
LSSVEEVRRVGPWGQAARRFWRQRLGVAALVVLLLIVAAGLLSGVIAPYGYNKLDLAHFGTPQPPSFSGKHFFGTNDAGKDLLSQTLYGIRASVKVALSVAALAGLIGVVVGALAGYYRGWVDAALARVLDVVASFPALLVLLAAFVSFGKVGLREIGLILIGLLWTTVARVVRSSVLSLREKEYVEAARAMGASDLRIIVRHLIPNTAGPIIVAVTSVIGQAILLEATIDFFGFGIYAAETATLGSLVADGFQQPLRGLATEFWWTYTFPTLAVVVLLLCVNYVGDSLDRALNPRA